MSTTAPLDVARLPTLVSGSRAPLWWAFLLLVVIETMVFATFIASYFYLRFGVPHWPPVGEPLPKLLLPTLNTLVLIASSVAVSYADSGISKYGDVKRLKTGMTIAVLLSVVFIALKVVEYAQVDYYWHTHAYGSVIWTIIVFHSAHVASVTLKGITVLTLAAKGHFTRYRHLGVQVNGIYWHFVALIWIPLYLTIYIAPRIT